MSKTLYLSYCFELPSSENGQLPQKIKILPAGAMMGNDGRTFSNSDPSRIIYAFETDPRDIALDIEHSTEIKAPKGEPAPAQGWFKTLEVIDGAIWGVLDLNEDGSELIRKKNYRYISPAFYHDENGNITKLSSVGLTNKPNLNLPSLNQEKETNMKLSAAICALLALNHETATEAQAIDKIAQLQADNKLLALNAQQTNTPDPTKYIPKETHELALNRASAAEAKLKELEDAEYTALVDDGIKAGKIAPANKDTFVALCRQQGKEAFTAFVDNLPEVVNTSGKPETPQGKQQKTQLSDTELAMCRSLGISEDEFLAAK